MSDKWDDVLGIAGMLDWVSPLAAFIQDLAHGPHYTFMIPYGSGMHEWVVADVLKAAGVTCWGALNVPLEHTIIVSVPKSEAARATMILDRAGIEVLNPVDSPARQRAGAAAGGVTATAEIRGGSFRRSYAGYEARRLPGVLGWLDDVGKKLGL